MTIRKSTESGLPIQEVLNQVTDTLSSGRVVILRAPPGAGKTTGVPLALLNDARLPSGEILLVQPRRLAARSAAHRLAALRREDVGSTVGYHVRFDRKCGPDTRLISMTTGIFLRRLTSDPLLEDVSCVILDEFHERSLDVDLALGMVHRIRRELRPELGLVVMSATMDPQPLLRLIPDSESVESRGRAFEVEVRYSRELRSDRLSQRITEVVPHAIQSTPGNILVFLPGVGEIHQTHRELCKAGIDRSVRIEKLYGDLSPQQQDQVLVSGSQRKLILSTNVAETSVTIEGVTGVIDSGLARVNRLNPAVGMTELRLENISQASADQRAGRAGRTQSGECWRLWPENTHRSRPEHTAPEIERADFSSAALMLSAWGERNWQEFPWVSQPREETLRAASTLLQRLGAIDSYHTLTPLGTRMVALPVHPRLARLLLESIRLGCQRPATLAAAVLSERNAFQRDAFRDQYESAERLPCDLMRRVARIESVLDGQHDEGVISGAAKTIGRVCQQLRRMVERLDKSDKHAENGSCSDSESESHKVRESFGRCLLVAFPDRLTRRREAGSDRGRMIGGRGVKLDRGSGVRTAEFFLSLDADAAGEEARVRMASAVEIRWLDQDRIQIGNESFFHPSLKAVVRRRRSYMEDVLLSEHPVACTPDDESARLLFEHASKNVKHVLPAKDKTLQSLLGRIEFAAEQTEMDDFRHLGEQVLLDVLTQLCATRTSFDELGKAPWLDYLKAECGYEAMAKLDQWIPESIEVPSGNRIRLVYESGKKPVLAVRIQEIFGWSETPRIADGRIPLQLHLLGPNHRPQQITDDLASFWDTTYHVVRKDLRRRYPKHNWPEEPRNAVSTRNGLKPR